MDVNFSQEEQAKMDFVDSLMAFNSISIAPKIKKDYLLKEHGDNVPLMKSIKKTIDPNNIMNPGKIFD